MAQPASVAALGNSLADHDTLPRPAMHCAYGLACREGLWILPGQPMHDDGRGDDGDPAHLTCVHAHLDARRETAAEVLAALATCPDRHGPGDELLGLVLTAVEDEIAETVRRLRLDHDGKPHVRPDAISARIRTYLDREEVAA
jgi:hypothetical protein